jgi:hypothetical protein
LCIGSTLIFYSSAAVRVTLLLDLMKQKASDREKIAAELARAMARARLWDEKAMKAQQDGRMTAARRCKDKARDWASKADQLARRQGTGDILG